MSWLYTVLFAGLVFSSQDSGTSALAVDEQQAPVAVERSQDETETFQQTYPLNANGRVRVSNVNGSITVEAWDRNEVQLSYTKTADTKERLTYAEVRIESQPGLFSVETELDDLKMRTTDLWRNGGRLTVDYRLMVPRGAVLNEIETVNGSVTVSNFTNITRVSAVNGSVKATNIRGTARLSTVNGEVHADFDRLDSGSRISLDTVNGKVMLTIPSDSSATLRADSVNGSIANDFGLPIRKGKYVGRDLYGKIGSGDVDIRLNSVNGPLTISRKNDGKSVAPAVNLLPQKELDDDWDTQSLSHSETVKLNKEIAKAVKESTKVHQKALAETKIQMDKLGPDIAKLAAESVEEAAKALRPELMSQMGALARLGDISFFPAGTRIEKQSDSIPLKGVPTVTIDARGCSVSIRGWDKNEVQYRVTQFSSPRDNKSLDIKETHTDNTVNLTVVNEKTGPLGGRMLPDQNRVRIEVYVPRKANLKIDASEEIRIEGVTGDVQLVGSNEPINVRDVDGKLRVNSHEGRVRVIGFTGDIDVRSVEGSINLEGDFRSLNAQSSDGSVMLTVPESVSADVDVTGSSVEGAGIPLTRLGGDEDRSKYRLRDGGRTYKIATKGTITIRSVSSITEGF